MSPPAPKKKWSTFAVVMTVLGVGFLVFVVALAIGGYAFFSSKEGKQIAGVMGEAMKMSKKAQNAPGTKELRAKGCAQAMVMDLGDFAKMAETLDAAPAKEDPGFGEMVICSVNPWATALSCDDVAHAYVATVGPRPKPFFALSQQAGKSKPACNVLYDAEGTRLRDFTDDPSGGTAPLPIPPPPPGE
jgi:hypothetical protein